MLPERVPVLDRRHPGNLDWLDANYQADVTQATLDRSSGTDARRVVSTNHLTGADPLAALVASGAARWCLEVRSTQTFYVKTFISEEGSNQVEATFPDHAVRLSTLRALPGLVAVRECHLRTEGMHPLWSRRPSIEVPRGTWLARTQHVELQLGLSGIVRFDGEDSIDVNRMKVEYASDGIPFWIAFVNPADLQRYQDEPDDSARAAILAALVGALADANRRPAFGGHGDADDGTDRDGPTHVAGEHLASRLVSLDPDCKLPGDEDFDPAYAASLLVGDKLLASKPGDADD